MCSDQQSSIFTALRDLVQENRERDIKKTYHLEQMARTLQAINKRHSGIASKEDLAEQSTKLSSIISTVSDMTKEQKILDSLHFRYIKVRQSDIPEAHAKTFNWIFGASGGSANDPPTHIRFTEWLSQKHNQQGIYWIAGKAGSGKSTLMKFLCNHERTKSALQKWAGTNGLLTASYFFWNSGTSMQKSQEGLLRSLLYEMFRQCPGLIPSISPTRWDASYQEHQEPWTRSELLEAFARLQNQEISSTRFCFFLDGLDEYDGNHLELVKILQQFAASASVKICLSSRPWEVFRHAFDGNVSRRLYLQDLTREDITIYVRTKLEENEHFIEAQRGDSRYHDLVVEIVERAQGVFLWVFLVVRSLLDGLTNGDTIAILQSRLRRLPSDLEQFFKHILDRVDEVYQKWTAHTFQIALKASEPLSLLTYSFLDSIEEDHLFALKAKIRTFQESEISSRYRTMAKRLDARSKGLLEVSLKELSESRYFYGPRVNFLHRTARDFLRTKDMQTMLAKRTDAAFNASVYLCRALLAEIKAAPTASNRSECEYIQNLVEDFAFYGRQAELETGAAQTAILDELDRVIQVIGIKHPCKSIPKEFHLLTQSEVPDEPVDSFLGFSVQRGLDKYIAEKLDKKAILLSQWPLDKRPLLDHALRSLDSPKYGITDLTGMVQLLLEHGADPNERFAGGTVWVKFLSTISRDDFEDYHMAEYYQKLLELLLKYHANPNVKLRGYTLWGRFVTPASTPRTFPIQAVELFFHYGADPNAQWKETTVWKNFLARMWARNSISQDIQPQLFEATKLFLSYGADLDATLKAEKSAQSEHHSISEVIHKVFSESQTAYLLQLLRLQQHKEPILLSASDAKLGSQNRVAGILLNYVVDVLRGVI